MFRICSGWLGLSVSSTALLLYFVALTLCVFTVQTFKDHMIDGETLPLLSEEHLLDTMGLKLGPALKIRSLVGNTEWGCQSL